MKTDKELIERLRAIKGPHNVVRACFEAASRLEALSSGEAVAWMWTYKSTGRITLEKRPIPDLPWNNQRWTCEPLYAAPALSSPMPSREEVAKIVDPRAFDMVYTRMDPARRIDRRQAAFAKADAILSPPPNHEGGR